MLKEFKNFILTGNVIDLAVGVIMAGAIGAVANGFVSNIVMPVVGHFSGGVDLSKLKYVLDPASADGLIPENAITYGAWINSIVSLVIVGLVMFMIVKAYNKSKAPEAPAPTGPSEVDLLTEIRDALKK